MEPVHVVEGPMVPLDRADIDTDQIMPKQYLKRIERTGFGEFVFADWRAEPDFVLNDPRYAGAKVLVSGPNFGCGSSREHAPWGIQQYGFEAVVAPSFADIFKSNCAKTGLLAVELPLKACRALVELAEQRPGVGARVDLPAQTITAGELTFEFAFDPHAKHLLTEGLDDIGQTLGHADDITAFETGRPRWRPVTTVT